MRKSNKPYLLAAAKQLKSHLQKPEYRGLRLDKAFIDWYITARYGKDHRPRIVDDSGDGGIDAIVAEGSTSVVLQSKYESVPRISSIGDKELLKFENLAQLFADASRGPEFTNWLSEVRKPLHTHYKRIRAKAIADPSSVRFDFVTAKKVPRRGGPNSEAS